MAYLASIFPHQLRAVLRYRVGALAGALAIYSLLLVIQVLPTAYAFVPGGQLFRERTDVVLASTFALIWLGIRNARSLPPLQNDATSEKMRTLVRTTAAVLVVLSIVISARRSIETASAHRNDRVVTAGIWTIHFGLDGGMRASERRMADLLRDAELDVVGLLESDTFHPITGSRDTTQYLAETLGYRYVDIGAYAEERADAGRATTSRSHMGLCTSLALANHQFDTPSPAVASRRTRACDLRDARDPRSSGGPGGCSLWPVRRRTR